MSAGGPTFDGPIRFGRPEAPHEAPTPESLHFVGPTWGSRFDLFFCICFQASFFVEFWDSCFMYVGFILTHFLNIS